MKIEHQIDPRTLEFVDSRPYKEKVKMLAALKLLDKEERYSRCGGIDHGLN